MVLKAPNSNSVQPTARPLVVGKAIREQETQTCSEGDARAGDQDEFG